MKVLALLRDEILRPLFFRKQQKLKKNFADPIISVDFIEFVYDTRIRRELFYELDFPLHSYFIQIFFWLYISVLHVFVWKHCFLDLSGSIQDFLYSINQMFFLISFVHLNNLPILTTKPNRNNNLSGFVTTQYILLTFRALELFF